MALERRGIVFVAFGLHDRSCEANKLDLRVGNVEPRVPARVPIGRKRHLRQQA